MGEQEKRRQPGRIRGISIGIWTAADEEGKTHVDLGHTCAVLLRRYLEKIYGKGNVYVPEGLFLTKGLQRASAEIEAAAERFFAGEEDEPSPAWACQDLSGEEERPELTNRCYWACYCLREGSQEEELPIFTKRALEKQGIGAPDIGQSRFAEKLREHLALRGRISISSGPVLPERAEFYSNLFREGVRGGIKQVSR